MNYAERNRPYWRRNLAVCVFGSFTTLVSLSMLLPFLPLYVQQLGVTAQADVGARGHRHGGGDVFDRACAGCH
jgi:DHA1 family multidrug resistance protein-like MFS transporter